MSRERDRRDFSVEALSPARRAALERAVDLSRLKGASAELQRAENIRDALEPA